MEKFENIINDSIEVLINDIVKYINRDKYCFLIEATDNSFTSGFYELDKNGATYSNETIAIFDAFLNRIQLLLKGKGILLIAVGAAGIEREISTVFIHTYNKELSTENIFDLVIFQELGIEPMNHERRQVLSKSFNAEKIKNTLVYACYENNTRKIQDLLEKFSNSMSLYPDA